MSLAGRLRPIAVRQRPAKVVEEVAALLIQLAGEKIDLSDRPINRSRTLAKGKTTPDNLTRETVNYFFNSIGHLLPCVGTIARSFKLLLRPEIGHQPIGGRNGRSVIAGAMCFCLHGA